MLRHYESLGLVRPSGRTGSGYREYSAEDIRRIFHIESLRSLGLSLREIGRALDDPGFTPSMLVGDLIRQTRDRIAAETELLTQLRRIHAADPVGWEDVLQVVALLQALGSKSADARQRAVLFSGNEVPVPVEALVEAALSETEPSVAGPCDGRLRDRTTAPRRCWRRASAHQWPRCGNVPFRPSSRCLVMKLPRSCGMPLPTPTPWSAGMRLWRSVHVVWPMRSRRSST